MIQAGRQERVCFYNGIYFIRDSEIIGWLTFSYLILLLNHCCYYPQTVFIHFPTMPIRMNFLSIRHRQIDKNFGGRAGEDARHPIMNLIILSTPHGAQYLFFFGQRLMLLFQRKRNYYIVTGRQDDRPTD